MKKMTWRQLYEISLSYRRLADLEIPILWLSMIYKEEHIGYHNEVSFYRSDYQCQYLLIYVLLKYSFDGFELELC